MSELPMQHAERRARRQPNTRLAAWLGVIALSMIALGAFASSADAQRLGGQRFSPAGSPDGVLGTEGADTRPTLSPFIGLWTSYALDPVVGRLPSDEEIKLVEHVLASDLQATMAVWRGLEVGFGLPISWWRQGDEADAAAFGFGDQNGVALGDMTLRFAYRFQLGYFTALAIHVPVLLPTTRESNLLGLGVGARPTIAFSHRFGALQLLLNLSVLLREKVDAIDYQGGHELGARAALRWGLGEQRLTGLLAEVGMSTAMRSFFGAAETPVEARVGVEQRFLQRWRATAMVGTGLTTGIGAPDVRVGVEIAYVPELTKPRKSPQDRDGDGIANADDRCPDEAEDLDGYRDHDGCPEPDNDGDGILDGEDPCPTAPENQNGFRDDDGCPDFVRLEAGEIVTLQPIYFTSNSDDVDQRSKPMVREVAQILRANPEMHVHIGGHADATGDAHYNRQLSQKRAETVRTFLGKEGVEGQRMTARGYGEDHPRASNETARGRATNRRVEFRIRTVGGKR